MTGDAPGYRRTLLVSSAESSIPPLSALLEEVGHITLCVSRTGAEARRLLTSREFDTVIINLPLSDEPGEELGERAATDCDAAVLLLVQADNATRLTYRYEQLGIAVLPKPLSRAMFLQTVRLLCAMRGRLCLLREENEKLRRRLEDMRVLSRAKCALVRLKNMTEAEAHRYLEKEAMDRRLPLRTVAEAYANNIDGQSDSQSGCS